jgi:ornithine decarboxylase
MNYRSLPSEVKRFLERAETPWFLHDLDWVSSKIDLLNRFLGPDKIFFALKCNSLPPVLDTIAKSGCGFEVNNAAELQKAMDTGLKPDRIINSSPKTGAADVREMYARGVEYFTFDSKYQADNLATNAPEAKVVLRIFSTNEGSSFDLSKNLGVQPHQAPQMISYAKDRGLHVCGVMFHVGSQCHSHYNWKVGLMETAELFGQFPELKIINIGGGFPVHYHETIPDIKEICDVVNETIQDFFEERPVLYVEPGRYITGDSALACTSVIQVDDAPVISKVTVDLSVFTGLMEIVEKCDGFHYPIETSEDGPTRLYRVFGPTCAGNDVIAEEMMLPALKADQVNPEHSSRLFLLNTGAYCLDYVSVDENFGFNGARIPNVFFMKDGKIVDWTSPAHERKKGRF